MQALPGRGLKPAQLAALVGGTALVGYALLNPKPRIKLMLRRRWLAGA